MRPALKGTSKSFNVLSKQSNFKITQSVFDKSKVEFFWEKNILKLIVTTHNLSKYFQRKLANVSNIHFSHRKSFSQTLP